MKLLHKLADEAGKTIGRHQAIHRPIRRYTPVEDTRPRELLLTLAMATACRPDRVSNRRQLLGTSRPSPLGDRSWPTKRRRGFGPDVADRGGPTLAGDERDGECAHGEEFAIGNSSDDEVDEVVYKVRSALPLVSLSVFVPRWTPCHDTGITDAGASLLASITVI